MNNNMAEPNIDKTFSDFLRYRQVVTNAIALCREGGGNPRYLFVHPERLENMRLTCENLDVEIMSIPEWVEDRDAFWLLKDVP